MKKHEVDFDKIQRFFNENQIVVSLHKYGNGFNIGTLDIVPFSILKEFLKTFKIDEDDVDLSVYDGRFDIGVDYTV